MTHNTQTASVKERRTTKYYSDCVSDIFEDQINADVHHGVRRRHEIYRYIFFCILGYNAAKQVVLYEYSICKQNDRTCLNCKSL